MLEQIDYKTIFHYFEEISKVPRGSYHNEKISDYLVQFAKERGIAYRQEECGNVIFGNRLPRTVVPERPL